MEYDVFDLGPVSVTVNYTFDAALDAGSYEGSAEDGSGGTDTLYNINQFNGTSYDDSFVLNIDSGGQDWLMDWYVWGGEGDDTITGSDGEWIRAMYLWDPDGVTADLENGTVTDGWGDTDTLVGVDGVSGSDAGDDLLLGSSGEDAFFGSDGDDVIDGRGGDSDWVSYGWLDLSGDITHVYVDLSADTAYGKDAFDNHLFTDMLYNIESAFGSNGDDELYGSSGNDMLGGYQGNDYLDGGSGGADSLQGGDGDDTFGLIDASSVDEIFDFQAGASGSSDILYFAEYLLGFTSEGVNMFRLAGSSDSIDPLAARVIGVTDSAASDWSDVDSVLDGAVTAADMNGVTDASYFVVSNDTDSRVYFWEGDTDSSNTVDDSELTLLADLNDFTDISSLNDVNFEIV